MDTIIYAPFFENIHSILVKFTLNYNTAFWGLNPKEQCYFIGVFFTFFGLFRIPSTNYVINNSPISD